MITAERLEETAARSPALQALLDCDEAEMRAAIKALAPRDRVRLLHDWSFWGRPEQVWRPGAEMHTVYLAGRGWGKTRVGAEAGRYVAAHPWLAGGRRPRDANDRTYGEGAVLGIAGRTANDVNETMLYGPSGLMTITPEHERPRHLASRKLLIWPNGARARLMSGDVPDSFRGPNFGWVWTDELAHWSKLKKSLAALRLALRHGARPRGVHTTTPIAVQPLIEFLFSLDESRQPRPARDGEAELQGFALKRRVRVVRGSTYDNADNLADDFLEETVGDFEGTDEGDQELRGLILFEVKGAPWRRDWIRRCEADEVPELIATVVAIDPTGSDGELVRGSDEPCECGIIVLGLGVDRRLYVLADLSGVMSSTAWGGVAVDAALKWGADRVVAEDNFGGDMVEIAIRAASPKARIKVQRVHATKSKADRAALVSPVWQTGRASHVGNPRQFVRLEHQMCSFGPTQPRSDRMDALVWGALALAGDGTDRQRLRALGKADAWDRIGAALAHPRGRRR